MNDYIKKAREFYLRGKLEYEEGLEEKDTVKVRKGCEEIFHSFVELSNGILSEHGIQIPKNHKERAKGLDTFGLGITYDSVKERLHDTCYYNGIVDKTYLDISIKIVDSEIKKRI